MIVLPDHEQEPKSLKPIKTSLERWLYLAIFIALAVMVVKMLLPVLTPVFFGILGAMISLPLFEKLNKKMNRNIASLLTCAVVFIGLITPVFFLLYFSMQQIGELTRDLAGQVGSTSDLVQKVEQIFMRIPYLHTFIDFPAIEKQFKDLLVIIGQMSLEFIKEIPDLFFQALIAGLCVYFFLSDQNYFKGNIYKQIPIRDEIIENLLNVFSTTANTMVIANIWAGAVQACLVGISFALLDVPLVFLGISLAFVLAWAPLFGCAPVWIGAAVFLAVKGLWIKAGLMIGCGAIIAASDNIIRPMILSGKSELHPLISLLSMICGAAFFGFAGLFLGPALVAVFGSVIQLWPKIFEEENKPSQQIILSHPQNEDG